MPTVVFHPFVFIIWTASRLISLLLATLFLLIFLLYFVFYKKVLKGEKKLPWKKLIYGVIFMSYIILVISATILNNWGHDASRHQFIPFSLYLSAINQPFFREFGEFNYWFWLEWRNLILSIIMFIPVGILLPLTFSKLDSLKKTATVAVLISFSVELVQGMFGFGIFATDDILNNTIGGIIGFKLFSYMKSIFEKVDSNIQAFRS